jgi:hypothetical protein
VISVIPKKVLAPDRTYTVTIEATWKGARKTWSWSFTTLSLRRIDASDHAAIAGAIGVPSLVRGTVAYGGEMNTSTVFLKIGESTGGVYEMLSVVIPRALWTEIAGTATPASWKGATLEVSASPQLVKGKFMNLTIADPSQLRVIAAPPPPARKRR